MASSSLTITCDRGIIRKYGGTRSNVKVKRLGTKIWMLMNSLLGIRILMKEILSP
ncbi:hypothetical protein [Bacillus thuringiensis]|uniref:hypothetical protein n=1 Tax=Bacillus thuringiensis TaxID=1428 RepID=UPI00149599DC|nr:hypothetical protein [Bacillus thuringiensis]